MGGARNFVWHCGTGAGLWAEPPRGGGALFPPTSLSTSKILFVAPGLTPESNPSLWEVVFQIRGGSTTPSEGTQGSVSSSPGSPSIIQIHLWGGEVGVPSSPPPAERGLSPQGLLNPFKGSV